MDGRVSKSLLRLEDLPYYGSFTKSIYAGKGVIFVLGNNSTRHKFNIGEGRGEETKAYLLYKQSVEGSGRSIPINREVGFCIDNDFQEAEALLPSSCHQCPNRSSAQENNEQVRSCGTIDPVGCQA